MSTVLTIFGLKEVGQAPTTAFVPSHPKTDEHGTPDSRFQPVAYEVIQHDPNGRETSRTWKLISHDSPRSCAIGRQEISQPDEGQFYYQLPNREEIETFSPPTGDYFLKKFF